MQGHVGLLATADEKEGGATIHAAVDAGINLIDNGDLYGSGRNELLIREALRGHDRSRILLRVKFGALREPQARWNGSNGRPKAVKNLLAYSLKRFGTDYIDIYRPSGSIRKSQWKRLWTRGRACAGWISALCRHVGGQK